MYFDSILSHSCSSMYGNLLGSNKWFSMWCSVRGKMSICSTGRTVHIALSNPLCVTQITQNTIRHNVCYSCRFPVLAVNLAVDFFFLSLGSPLYIPGEITAKRSEAKLFQPCKRGLITRHVLKYGVCQRTSNITSDHNKHPVDHNHPPVHF